MSSTLQSGEVGTTGREVFEHSTATGPGPGYGRDHGESATTGFEGSAGIGAGGQQHHYHDTTGGPPAQTGSVGHDLVGGTAGAAGREVEGADPHANTGAHIPGTTGTGGGIPPPAPSQGEPHHGHHHHHHHHHPQDSGVAGSTGTGIGGSDQSQISSSYGDNSISSGGVTDRVGNLNQGGAMYERTTDRGPVTGGAAGTDRFDSDRSGSTGRDAYPDLQESTTRAEGKSSGGLMGVLGTSDKDFTGRDRLASGGAYADTHGSFQGNTSGPGGHSALTGREGNIANNPVAQAQGVTSANDAGLVPTTGQGTGRDENMLNDDGSAPKTGLLEKMKGMFTA